MKANELRIGNWYNHNGIPTQVTPNTIEEVWEAERIWCKAIPLTEEWLLKFGFIDLKERCGLNGIYSIIGKQIHINIETKSYCQIDYEGSVCDIVKIEYVHDLQNIFYALNKEELTYGGNNGNTK